MNKKAPVHRSFYVFFILMQIYLLHLKKNKKTSFIFTFFEKISWKRQLALYRKT